ncbi:hypothetical protein JCM31267_37950 [Blautia wexlerae]
MQLDEMLFQRIYSGYYGASHDIPAADRPVGIIRWGELECW